MSALDPAQYILRTAASEILSKCKSLSPAGQTLPMAALTQSQSRGPRHGPRSPPDLAPCPLPSPFAHTLPSLTPLQPRWPPDSPGPCPLQDLCTHCSRCLSPGPPPASLCPSLPSCRSLFSAYVSKSPSLTSLFKSHLSLLVPSPENPPRFLLFLRTRRFVPCHQFSLFILFAFLSPLKTHLVGVEFCLFCSIPPVPRTCSAQEIFLE